jgi:hypothetical protein
MSGQLPPFLVADNFTKAVFQIDTQAFSTLVITYG